MHYKTVEEVMFIIQRRIAQIPPAVQYASFPVQDIEILVEELYRYQNNLPLRDVELHNE